MPRAAGARRRRAGAAAPEAGAPAQPEVMEIVKDTFGDWQVRCAPDGDECFMYQLAVDQAKNPVAEVSILKLPEQSEADAGVTVVTPLGTLLTTGVIVEIDGGEKRQYPFAWCSQVGCFARFGLDKPRDRRAQARQGRQDHPGLGRPARGAGGARRLALGLHRRLRLARRPGAAGGGHAPRGRARGGAGSRAGRPPPGAAPLARAQALRPQPPPARRAAMSASTARTMLSTLPMSTSDRAGSLALNGTRMSKASSMARTASISAERVDAEIIEARVGPHLGGIEHRLPGEDRHHPVPDGLRLGVGHAPSRRPSLPRAQV